MKRSSDHGNRADPLDDLFDEVVRLIVEAARDWRNTQAPRPGDDTKWGRTT